MNSRLVAAATALCFGVALVTFAWPRFVGGAIIAPYGDLLRAVARGANPSLRKLDAARDAAAVSLDWFTYGETMRRRGAFDLVLAGLVTSPSAQKTALDQSMKWLRAGLARAPGEAFSWLQLAQATLAAKGPVPAINGPLRMSIRTARYEQRLVIPRLDVAFRSWEVLDPDVRHDMTFQIRRAIDIAPLALVRLTRQDFALRQVLDAVRGDPVHEHRFSIIYAAPR